MLVCHIVRVVDHLSDSRGVIGDSLSARVSDIQRFEIRGEGNAIRLLQTLVNDTHGAGVRVEAIDSSDEGGSVSRDTIAKGVV